MTDPKLIEAINALTQAIDAAVPCMMDAVIASQILGANLGSPDFIAQSVTSITDAILSNRMKP